MAEGIILALCALLTAAPFFALSLQRNDSHEPIPFFSGDESLKKSLSDIAAYNLEMAVLYRRYAICLVCAALSALFSPLLALILLALLVSLGLFIVHRRYKAIRAKHACAQNEGHAQKG